MYPACDEDPCRILNAAAGHWGREGGFDHGCMDQGTRQRRHDVYLGSLTLFSRFTESVAGRHRTAYRFDQRWFGAAPRLAGRLEAAPRYLGMSDVGTILDPARASPGEKRGEL